MAQDNKIAKLGAPSYVWLAGQKRRLGMIQKFVPLEGKRILDFGCGVGMYLKALQQFTNDVYGVEIDKERAEKARRITPNVFITPDERLPFSEATFDVVLFNEVLEHVGNDRRAVEEAVRVLKRGGHIVIFAPNRLFPFETHGFYLPTVASAKAGRRGRYIFGNIPLINYLPNRLRNKLSPHVRAYTIGDIKRLLGSLPVRFVVFTQIYPGFDKIFARIPLLGNILRQVFYFLEKTPLRIFGLSHFVIVRKTG